MLVAANLTATLVRFGLYRTWVFRHPRPGSPPGRAVTGPPGRVRDAVIQDAMVRDAVVNDAAVVPSLGEGDFR